jgi:hypothetical protein
MDILRNLRCFEKTQDLRSSLAHNYKYWNFWKSKLLQYLQLLHFMPGAQELIL